MGKESRSDGGRRFLGIPYAAPPVGNLRWRTPQPPTEWTGVRKALNFGASCMQNPESVCVVGYGGTPSEDCLFLNVYTPSPKNDTSAEGSSVSSGGFSTASSDLLPIMIFYHVVPGRAVRCVPNSARWQPREQHQRCYCRHRQLPVEYAWVFGGDALSRPERRRFYG